MARGDVWHARNAKLSVATLLPADPADCPERHHERERTPDHRENRKVREMVRPPVAVARIIARLRPKLSAPDVLIPHILLRVHALVEDSLVCSDNHLCSVDPIVVVLVVRVQQLADREPAPYHTEHIFDLVFVEHPVGVAHTAVTRKCCTGITLNSAVAFTEVGVVKQSIPDSLRRR